ncbi:MAG: D-sedoheptulose-7-phosphate isomerase [Actinomycetota bacterium]
MDKTLEKLVTDGYSHRERVVGEFFEKESSRLAQACHQMALRFHHGGRILAFGVGGAATDAQHIAVEFVHPVIVGKKALPAIAFPNDSPTLLGLSEQDPASVFLRPLDLLGRPDDIAIGLSLYSDDPGVGAVAAALKEASANGMMSLALVGPGQPIPGVEWVFQCDEPDPFIVQEVHETLYHVLWELVHVFFEHRGLLEGTAGGSHHDVGASSFLYPFLSGTEKGLDSVLEQVRSSIILKAKEVIEVRARQAERPHDLVEAATLLATQFAEGRQVFAFGNGGSATDAQDLVTDLMFPPPGMRPLPAMSLTNEEAVITAVANDVGFDNIFARQLIAFGQPGDVAVGISTSGGSRNHLGALEEARRRKMKTLAFVGYDGGETVARGLADIAVIVDHDYIPRIQEAQASQYHLVRLLTNEIISS